MQLRAFDWLFEPDLYSYVQFSDRTWHRTMILIALGRKHRLVLLLGLDKVKLDHWWLVINSGCLSHWAELRSCLRQIALKLIVLVNNVIVFVNKIKNLISEWKQYNTFLSSFYFSHKPLAKRWDWRKSGIHFSMRIFCMKFLCSLFN